MNLVFIEWTDAVGCSAGWDERCSLDEYQGNCFSCGLLLDEDDAFYLVAGHVTADLKTQQGGMAIPKAMVRRFVKLETP